MGIFKNTQPEKSDKKEAQANVSLKQAPIVSRNCLKKTCPSKMNPIAISEHEEQASTNENGFDHSHEIRKLLIEELKKPVKDWETIKKLEEQQVRLKEEKEKEREHEREMARLRASVSSRRFNRR